ncbi:hypothetical protein [Candidatus Nitronereus thalassa]|uniref:Uncharacterized protein n=1 Tax=Candidatus Nitronereus thalassa TaxID=3020898 RepID=A0ABU3KBH9_9BACT|nr:hypothetical protein [Candidatus Nitronereus thalassa]MDT7043758.1 hypothetical protein [Candidatus Nitronereus thalassa]
MNRPIKSSLFVYVLIAFLSGIMLSWLSQADQAIGQLEPRQFITTKGLQIVNDKGEPRASLFLWDGEHPALILGDKTCDRRLALTVRDREQAALTLFGENCKRRAVLETQTLGGPEFVLRDHQDVPRARIQLLADGTPTLTMYGPNGGLQWKAPLPN